MNYTAALATVDAKGDRNACVPIATSIVTDVPLEDVLKTFSLAGRRRRCATTGLVWLRANKLMGLRREPIPYQGKTVVTVERWLQRHHKGERLMVYMRGHVAAFDGHKIDDWSKGSRRRVTEVWRLVTEPTN